MPHSLNSQLSTLNRCAHLLATTLVCGAATATADGLSTLNPQPSTPSGDSPQPENDALTERGRPRPQQSQPPSTLNPQPSTLKNRFRLSYRPAFNISADFKRLGAFPAQTNPGGPTGSGSRTYDDGYVRPDSSANPGLTWNWGYENASQVPGDDTIQFHSSTSRGDGSSLDNDDSPYHGLELSYSRYFGKMGQRATWGLEAAFAYNILGINDNSPASSSVRRLKDTYALDGVIPPEPPYNGTFDGPGPLISDSPMRTFSTIPGGARVTGRRAFDADLFGLRLGPYLEIPLDDAHKWNVDFSGGIALAVISSEFRYRESTTIPGSGTFNSSGSGTDSDSMVGGYFGGNISYSFTKSWSAFMGASYQYLPGYSQKVDGRTARITFSRSVLVNLGFGFAF